MDKTVKALWTAALRSGKYQQGAGQLRQEDYFCCLGVLCDLYREHVDPSMGWDPHRLAFRVPKDEDGDGTYIALPPEVVTDWAGLGSIRGEYGDDDEAGILTEHNDGGMTFAEIADIIEKHF